MADFRRMNGTKAATCKRVAMGGPRGRPYLTF